MGSHGYVLDWRNSLPPNSPLTGPALGLCKRCLGNRPCGSGGPALYLAAPIKPKVLITFSGQPVCFRSLNYFFLPIAYNLLSQWPLLARAPYAVFFYACVMGGMKWHCLVLAKPALGPALSTNPKFGDPPNPPSNYGQTVTDRATL